MTSSKALRDSRRNMRWLIPLTLILGLTLLAIMLNIPDIESKKLTVLLICIMISCLSIIGVFALTHVFYGYVRRRALAANQREIDAEPRPVLACGSDGVIVLQNEVSVGEAGKIIGQNINNLIAQYRADAEGARLDWSARAAKGGFADVKLNADLTLTIRVSPASGLQNWAFHQDKSHDAVVAPVMQAPSKLEDFEVIPAALIRLSADGHILRANAAARQLLHGVLPDQPKNSIHLEAIFDRLGQAAPDWLGELMSGAAESRTEMLRLRNPDESGGETSERYIQIVLSPTASDPPGYLAALTDASELKTLEAQFVQSQKMQAIGQLAGGIAHDFNNLLTAIRGHSDLLMLRHDRAHPDYADLDQISQNANRAAALVGQLLSFSRKQTLKLERLDLRDIMADLAHLLNRLVGGKASLQISHDPSLMSIRADRRLLEQVIMNLVVNARDAMPEGGDIRLATENRVLDKPLLRDGNTLPAGEYVCISVSDTGCGISPEHMSKIFEPFFTTKAVGEGTGLGLSTVHGIVNQTGGFILCDSEPQKGTVFSIYFPVVSGDQDEEPNPPAYCPAVATISSSERLVTILLVEDEASVRAVAARALRLKGFAVHEAEGGQEALTLLDDRNLKPDIYVTDVVMPGMDGPTWVRKALQDRPGTRVVFMSGYSEDVFTDGKLPVPHSAFLAKPFTLVELAQTVQKQLVDSETATRLQ